MPINFPSSPTSGSQYTYGSKTWRWNGYAWDIVTPTTISTFNGCTSSAITITGTANEVTVDTTCPNIVIGLPNNLVVQNLTVTGSLLVSGGITTQMSEVVLIEDNFVTLNANVTAGAPTENAGIIISRGASANVDLRWNETSDNWQFTNNGTDYWNLPIDVVNTFNGLTGAVSFSTPLASSSVTGVASFDNEFVVSALGAVSLTSNYVKSFNGLTGTVSFSTPLASSSVTGVASFDNEFVVSALGAVSLTSNYVKSFNGLTGTVSFSTPLASSSATGVASFNVADFVVGSTGHVGLTGTIARTNVNNQFSTNQTVSGNIVATQLLQAGNVPASGIVVVSNTDIESYTNILGQSQKLVFSPAGNSVITLPSGVSGTVALVGTTVATVNGATGPITITGAGGAVLFTQSGRTGAFDVRLASSSVTGVASFNVADFVVGSTGHVGLTGTVARKNSDNSFSTIQTFGAGISASGGLTAVGDYLIGSGSGAIRGVPSSSIIALGDENGINNGTAILIDDSISVISVKSTIGYIYIGDVDGVNTGNVLEINPSGSLISLFFPEVYTNGYMNAYEGYRIGSGAINAQTGTSYTLTGSDNGKIVTFNNGSAVTVTIPTGLPVGFNCTAIQLGAGQVGFTNAAGLTMQSYGNQYKMIGQHASATIIEYTTNIVNLSGNLIV